MKNKCRSTKGSILFMSLFLLTILSYALVSLMTGTSQDIRLTREFNNYKRVLAVAESGADKARADLWNLILDGEASAQTCAAITPPEFENYVYETSNGKGSFGVVLIDSATSSNDDLKKINNGKWTGMTGRTRSYIVISGVTDTATGKSAIVKREIQEVAIPVFQFGIFYDNTLEVHPGGRLFFDGWIHTNKDLYGSNAVTFYDKVTVGGKVIWGERENGDKTSYNNIQVAYDDDKHLTDVTENNNLIDSRHENWQSLADSKWNGRIQDASHHVEKLELPIPSTADPHDIIEPASDSDSEELAATKFENNADLRLSMNPKGELVFEQKQESGDWENWNSSNVGWLDENGAAVNMDNFVPGTDSTPPTVIVEGSEPHYETRTVTVIEMQTETRTETIMETRYQVVDNYTKRKIKKNGKEKVANRETWSIEGDFVDSPFRESSSDVLEYWNNGKVKWQLDTISETVEVQVPVEREYEVEVAVEVEKEIQVQVDSETAVVDTSRIVNYGTGEVVAEIKEFSDFRQADGQSFSGHNISSLDINVGELANIPNYPSEGQVIYVNNDYKKSGQTAAVRFAEAVK